MLPVLPRVRRMTPTRNKVITLLLDSGLVGSTDFHSSHPYGHEQGEGTTIADDAQGTPTQSHVSPSILEYEDNCSIFERMTGLSTISSERTLVSQYVSVN